MEKITIEVENKEELLNALNNAIVTLQDEVYAPLFFCCKLPSRWEKWLDKHEELGHSYEDCMEIVKSRLDLLTKIFKKLEETT